MITVINISQVPLSLNTSGFIERHPATDEEFTYKLVPCLDVGPRKEIQADIHTILSSVLGTIIVELLMSPGRLQYHNFFWPKLSLFATNR